jgi:ribosomal protein S12 methylthiotransferase accessory factor
MLGDPRVLRFASALVLPVCDVAIPARKYGNRATLFAQLEVGQSLQNSQLMATALDLGAMVRGDTASQAVQDALSCLNPGITTSICLPALVLGARPTVQEVACQKGDRRFDIAKGLQLHRDGFAFTAGPIQVGAATVYASGRAADPRLALRKAEAEAWEREGWATPSALVEGLQRDVACALDPRCIVAYAPEQYQSPAFPFRPFSARRRYLWKAALDVQTGKAVHLPAECVHALAELPAHRRRGAFTSSSSSGVAAWTDVEGALCRATLELLERDAFLRCWLRRNPGAPLASQSLPAAARLRVEALRAAGYLAVISLLPASVPVVSIFLQTENPPFTAITAAADFEAEAALAKALDEAEGRAAYARAFRPAPVRSAQQVRGIEDVVRYYQSPRHFRASDFYAGCSSETAWSSRGVGWCKTWSELKSKLTGLHLPLLAADLTPSGAAIDQGRTPLHVVRALIPGLLPIWFQHGLHPAGLPAFRDALATQPRPRAPRTFIHPFT